MKVLVTGGSGFIGGYVLRHLAQSGHQVTNFDVVSKLFPDVREVIGSILDRNLVTRLVGEHDAIFHFAGFANINKVKENPVACLELNIMSTAYFMDAVKNTDKAFFLASSVYVHDDNGHFYTTSKQCAEKVCHNYHQLFGVSSGLLRLGTVYGEQSRHEDVISIFVKRALQNQPLVMHGDGSQARNFIHGEDVARACAQALSHRKKEGVATFVLAGEAEVSVKDVALKIQSRIPSTVIKAEPTAERVKEYSGVIVGLTETYEALEWRPEVGINEGIDRLIRNFNS